MATAIMVDVAGGLPLQPARFLAREAGLRIERLPWFYTQDICAAVLGRGEDAYARARGGLARWTMFDLGWTRVANPEAQIKLGAVVAVEARTLGLWTVNLSRIVEVIDEPDKYGFIYQTTEMHVEQGEERFLVWMLPETGEVRYEVEAVSRPRDAVARMFYPVARHFQAKFRVDTVTRMQREVSTEADRAC